MGASWKDSPTVSRGDMTAGKGARGWLCTCSYDDRGRRLPEDMPMPDPERIDPRRAALIAYGGCRRARPPSDSVRNAAMRPVLDAWVRMIAAARAAGVPVIYTTPVSRADGADVVMLPTDLSAETGGPPPTQPVAGGA